MTKKTITKRQWHFSPIYSWADISDLERRVRKTQANAERYLRAQAAKKLRAEIVKRWNRQ